MENIRRKPKLKNERYIPPLARITLRPPEECAQRLQNLAQVTRLSKTQVDLYQPEHAIWQFRVQRSSRLTLRNIWPYYRLQIDGTLMEWTQERQTKVRAISRTHPYTYITASLLWLLGTIIVVVVALAIRQTTGNNQALLLPVLIVPVLAYMTLYQAHVYSQQARFMLMEEIKEVFEQQPITSEKAKSKPEHP